MNILNKFVRIIVRFLKWVYKKPDDYNKRLINKDGPSAR